MTAAIASSRRPRRLLAPFACLLPLAVLTVCWSAPSIAAVLAGWDFNALPGGANNFGPSPLAPTTTDPNLTVGGLTRGSGLTLSGSGAANAWGATGWDNASAATAASGGDYATFTVQASAGHQVSFSTINKFDFRRSGTGPKNGVLQYQLGGGTFTDVTALSYGTGTTSTTGTLAPIDLTGVAALQNVPAGTTVTFRIVNYNGAAGGTWYINGINTTTVTDFEVSGTVGVGGGLVNGACGSSDQQFLSSAPSTNLCAAGTPSSVSGAGPWTWSCAGSGGGTTASCSANPQPTAPLTVFHTNDVHARLTPHKWQINQHGSDPPVFEDVGGAAYLAGEMLTLVGGSPTALVLDGGDISEGNPIGDMNCTVPLGGGTPDCTNANNSYGNGGMTAFYSLLHTKLAALGGARGARGIDALVVGNHDVRDISYIQNMEQMHAAGVPVISVNVRDISTHLPHFAPYTTVLVDGHKVGIVGYTTSTATVGASLANTLEVVDCQWTGSSVCNISEYVRQLREDQHCDIVILLTHDGHSDLVDPDTPILKDDPSTTKVPEIAVTGHWHTWAETVWQPDQLHYKTIFTESSSYMKYIGELHVDNLGHYVSSTQHVLRNADITPEPAVQALVDSLISAYNDRHASPVNEIVGYTNDNLELDNRMKWWSADEYPWSGNNSAGQWITDSMKWKCDHIAWPSGGGCDLAIEAGGGVRADIPAGAVTYMQVYETFPWADDTYVRVSMTGQDIINFLKATNLDTGFSREMDVTAFDGIIQSVLVNGAPIGLSTVYKVAINNYMLAHPPSGYVWPGTVNAEADPNNELVRDSLSEFMRSAHNTPATAYSVGGERYHFNGEYSGGYRAVVTMMNDNDTKPAFEDAFIRLLSANDETLARRGSRQVPTSIVNADGSVVAGNRLAEQELYRSFLGFKNDVLHNGDIVQVWGKASFFGGDPEFVDQEGVYGDGQEFLIVGHDASLAKPAFVGSVSGFMNDNYKNHYVKFLAKKAGPDTVVDQNGTLLKVWDRTGFASFALPGTAGTTILEITGVPTSESFGLRFRGDTAVASTATLPAQSEVASHVSSLLGLASAPITLTATAAVTGGGFALTPVADAQVESGGANATKNFGTTNNLFVEGSNANPSFGIERGWLKFDLSGLPAGSTITSATLELWNWSSSGASMPTEVRSSSVDSWTETGITFANQPAFGAVLDTQTLVSGVTNHTYSWNVASFVQSEFAGDKTVSLLVKPVDEAGSSSYGFDAKEFGSNAPILRVTTSANASSVANVAYFYRYSTDNTNWNPWAQVGAAVTIAPYNAGFSFPNGFGYYEFYSVATDNLGHSETTPIAAQSAVHYQAATGASQTISFGTLPSTPVGATLALSATATSGLPVVFSSQTSSVCTVTANQVTTLTTGTCTVAADQPGNVGIWLPASTVPRSFPVTLAPQTITFDPIASLTVGGTASLSATATSGLTVTFSTTTGSVCSVSGTTLTALHTGTCTVLADQAGDSSWLAAITVPQNVVVQGLAQTITFNAIGDRQLEAGAFSVSATANSGLPVSIVSQTTSICTISGNVVTPLAAGTCTLVASQAGDSTYAPAPNMPKSFSILSNGSGGPEGDAPLPLWAWVLLALTLFGAVQYRRGSRA